MTSAFNLGLAAYLAALLFAGITLFVKKRWTETVSLALMLLGVAAQTAYMGMRWHAAARAPFSNMFESLVLFAWAVVAVYLAVRTRLRIPVLGMAAVLVAVLTLAYATFEPNDIRPLMPALQSNWLSVHVFTCFLGYAGFAISALAAGAYLVASWPGFKAGVELQNALEIVSAKTVAFGFLFLTVGIITGSVWANSAWGSYWSWDPKETWSLITWFVYAVYLHCRFMRGWHGRRAAWISLIGFFSVLFTYVGVNYFLKGLHSYA